MTLFDQLKENGFALCAQFPMDGEIHRFDRNGALNGWFRGRVVRSGDITSERAFYGDFKTGEEYITTAMGAGLTLAQVEELELLHAKAMAEAEAKKLASQEETALACQEKWETAITRGTTPYLERKKLTSLYGARICPDYPDTLLVPAFDVNGKMWGIQRILGQKNESGIDKLFAGGMRIDGCSHMVGGFANILTQRKIYLAEGYATAASIYEATKTCTFACFNAGNLLKVANAIKEKWPEMELIICADDDRHTKRQDGTPWNPGIEKAMEVGRTYKCPVLVPRFVDHGLPYSDWNDLHCTQGLEEVAKQIEAGLKAWGQPQEEAPPPPDTTIASAESKKPPKPKKKEKPPESYVARIFLSHYADTLLCQGPDVFLYRDGYWQHQNQDGVKLLKRQIAAILGALGGSRDIESAWKYILIHAPTPPPGVNLFTPQWWSANFTNGTLHFTEIKGQKPTIEFKPHRKEDWHITQLPFAFPGLDSLNAVNTAFDEMLTRIWAGDPDASGKVRALGQLMGSCVMPVYPKIVFMVGARGSGKSTVMKIINRLIDDRNISRVDPSHFHGFHMATMVGRLVNMDTDINLNRPIQDDMIKKIIDRIKLRVTRKHQDDLEAPLPPIHIFGGNDMPVSNEGSTGAYERRVIVLRFGAYSAEASGGYDLNFDKKVWESGVEGILAFAIRGLIDLIEHEGHFHVPESSKEEIKQWDGQSDILGQFLEACEYGEVSQDNQVLRDAQGVISRGALWVAFNHWRVTYAPDLRVSEKGLCQMMRRKGFLEKRTNTGREWIGVKKAPSTVRGLV